MNDFDVLIGGSSDIGIAIISKIISNGRNIIYTYNNNSDITARIQTIPNPHHCQIICRKLNINSIDDITEFTAFIDSEKKNIKSLIYNVGKTKDSLFQGMTDKDFLDVMDTNLYGCFRICKSLINNIAINQGSIVLISSISGLMGRKGQVNYSCSKAGMIALCRNIATEYARLGVRANCVAPGFIKTKMLDKIPSDTLKSMISDVPMKRLGTPMDVANITYFLLSDESKYITGQTFVVDGGLLMK